MGLCFNGHRPVKSNPHNKWTKPRFHHVIIFYYSVCLQDPSLHYTLLDSSIHPHVLSSTNWDFEQTWVLAPLFYLIFSWSSSNIEQISSNTTAAAAQRKYTMLSSSISAKTKTPVTRLFPERPEMGVNPPNLKMVHSLLKPVLCCCSSHNHNPNTINNPAKSSMTTNPFAPIIITTNQVSRNTSQISKGHGEKRDPAPVGSRQMTVLCGIGYWMQGFRCFPWLALNFHMANNLNLQPSTLQLLQQSGNLPMVAKPMYGILSDALYIGGNRRIPYVLIGVLFQILCWGPLALIPAAREALPILISCILLGNLGASIEEVAKDALVAEYGQKHRIAGLQSYAFMALAVGGILGNLVGGSLLHRAPPKTMFLIFAVLLAVQLAVSSTVREKSLRLAQPSDQDLQRRSIQESIRKQLSDVNMALHEDSIARPLIWIVASVAIIPILSGSMFCYQIQCLQLNPSVIGISKVIGQLMLLAMTVLYDRYWKEVPMRRLIGAVQFLYATSFLLDFVLVKQINLRLGIPNEVFVCLFSGLAEVLAQFKILPFSVLLASLCPQGCEASLTSFFASALCLSSIFSGFFGVGLASLFGITYGDYSNLPVAILIQFVAALLPLGWVHRIPMSQPIVEKEKKRVMSKRTRKNRRVGRVVLDYIYAYRREREYDTQR